MEQEEITMLQALDYEIRCSFFARYISNDTLQNWVGSYYAWKVNRKYKRYKLSKYRESLVKRLTV